jgi:hypothetical protein
MTKDAQVNEALRYMNNYLWEVAKVRELEFDEVENTAVVVILENLELAQAKQAQDASKGSWKAYLFGAVRNAFRNVDKKARYHGISFESLDTPRYLDESSRKPVYLAEVLPAQAVQTRRPLKRERALYSAIARLSRPEQDYVREVQGIYGFDRRRSFNNVPPLKKHRAELCRRVFRHLRRDEQLAQVVLHA